MHISTISTHYLHVALKYCGAHNIDAHSLLKSSQINISLIENSAETRISNEKFALFSKNIQLAMQDEALGYYKNPQKLGTLATLVNHMSTAENVQQALRYAQRFYQLMDFGFHLELVNEGSFCNLLIVSDSKEALDPWVYEEQFTKTHRILRWLCNHRLPIYRIDFPFAAPQHKDEYKLLFGTEVLFNQSYGCMIFESDTLKLPLTRSREEVQQHQDDMAYNLLKLHLDYKTYTERVKQELINHLPETITYQKISENMNIHQQTLRRRLILEGNEFREIKSELMHDLAVKYLGDDALSTKQIAYLLGFKETGSFCRSFKKWTGCSPLTYKKQFLKNKNH